MSIQPYQVTILVGLLLAIVELTTTTFFFLGLAVGVLSDALLQFALGNFSASRDVVAASVFSLVAVMAFRRKLRRKGDQAPQRQGDVNQY